MINMIQQPQCLINTGSYIFQYPHKNTVNNLTLCFSRLTSSAANFNGPVPNGALDVELWSCGLCFYISEVDIEPTVRLICHFSLRRALTVTSITFVPAMQSFSEPGRVQTSPRNIT